MLQPAERSHVLQLSNRAEGRKGRKGSFLYRIVRGIGEMIKSMRVFQCFQLFMKTSYLHN